MKQYLLLKIKNLVAKVLPEQVAPTVSFELRDEQIKKIVDETFLKFRDNLPDSMCFMCKGLMKGYRISYRDHLFCGEGCHKEYMRVVDKPDEDYKVASGHKIGEKKS